MDGAGRLSGLPLTAAAPFWGTLRKPQRVLAFGVPVVIDRNFFAGLNVPDRNNFHHQFIQQLFELRVLDPAMGSGHFLVESVDFITDRLLKFLNQFPINPVNFALERTRTSILESLGEQGVTEVVYQPAGPDIGRELATFAEAAAG